MMKISAAASLFLLVAGVTGAVMAGTGTVMASDDCHVPMEKWQPREAVRKMVEEKGWQVSRIKIDDGCYQIRGVDQAGQAFKAKIDPATLSIVKMKRRGFHDRNRARERQRAHQADIDQTQNTPSANKLFDATKPPKAIVK